MSLRYHAKTRSVKKTYVISFPLIALLSDNNIMRLWFFMALFALTNTFGEEKEINKEKEVEKKEKALSSAHTRVSNTILYLSNRVDSFFGTERGDDEANGSRLRVFYDNSFVQDQKWDRKLDLRFSLRLPNLQKLLSFSYDSDRKKKREEVSIKDEPTSATSDLAPPSPSKLLETLKKWNFGFNTGLRVGFPPNPFATARLRRTFLFGPFEFNPTQEATWFLRDGVNLTFSHDLETRLAHDLLFRVVNTAFWLESTNEVSTSHGPVLFHQLSPRRAISYSLLASGLNRPKFAINNYALSLLYRQRIVSNWVFVDVSPTLSYPRSNGWKEVYSLFVRIEALFGSL